jgi:hypothetical protein
MTNDEIDELHDAVRELMGWVLRLPLGPHPRLELVDNVNKRWPKAERALREGAEA